MNPYKTLPMGCIDGTFYSHWYMPYAKGAKLVFTNDGEAVRKVAVEIDTVKLDSAKANKLLRFCAAWHSDDFTGLDMKRFMRNGGDRWPDWPLLVVEGKGRFVGMALHVWKFGSWWGEGDERFFIDGEKYPSTVGTGSEDYIGYAYAARPPFITFDSALASVSRMRPDAQEDTSNCRFHICDDLPFSKSFQGFIETWTTDRCRPVLFDTCVYWYRESGARNPYPVVPLADRRHQRPGRHMPYVTPPTFQIPRPKPPKPGTIEGENLRVMREGSGKTWVQNMANYREGTWSGQHQLIWTEGEKGDSVEMQFTIPKDGKHELVVVLTKAKDYGIVQLAIDGRSVGEPIDCYSPTVTTTDEVSLGTFDLKAGKHVLKATAVGNNPQARDAVGKGSHIFGIDYLRLKPSVGDAAEADAEPDA